MSFTSPTPYPSYWTSVISSFPAPISSFPTPISSFPQPTQAITGSWTAGIIGLPTTLLPGPSVTTRGAEEPWTGGLRETLVAPRGTDEMDLDGLFKTVLAGLVGYGFWKYFTERRRRKHG